MKKLKQNAERHGVREASPVEVHWAVRLVREDLWCEGFVEKVCLTGRLALLLSHGQSRRWARQVSSFSLTVIEASVSRPTRPVTRLALEVAVRWRTRYISILILIRRSVSLTYICGPLDCYVCRLPWRGAGTSEWRGGCIQELEVHQAVSGTSSVNDTLILDFLTRL